MLGNGLNCDRQLEKGLHLKKEGYVRNIVYNYITHESEVILIREMCMPSMKSGYYMVNVALGKDSGKVSGAHCQCPEGYHSFYRLITRFSDLVCARKSA